MRFERDLGSGLERVFPETFSFHADRHDPAELYLRLDDLFGNPTRVAPGANRRDAEELVQQLLAALPSYLADLHAQLSGAPRERAAEDIAVFGLVAERFLQDKDLTGRARLRMASLHLRKLTFQVLHEVMEDRVRPEFVEGYEAGERDPETSSDPHDTSFFQAIAAGDADRIDATVVGAAERATFRWVEEVCLDDESGAFGVDDSPFGDRESEVLSAVSRDGEGPIVRSCDLSPFLCRQGSRDCLRLLKKLEVWFLRRYDIRHAAATMHHAARLGRREPDPERVLSRLSTRTFLLALLVGAAPFLLAVPFYDLAPRLFDWVAAGEMALIVVAAIWFLIYRFLWKKDLTFFHASVPRIGAGIIVGYLPVFLIDEVWDLAEQSLFYLLAVVVMLGTTTLLYLYVEVQQRLGDSAIAMSRAIGIFLLGLVEAAGFGLLVTGLLGPLMAARNWGPEGLVGGVPALREAMPPFVGQLPPVLGIEPLYVFPTAVLLMSFLSFFIGTFLQLLWEDLPITEPL